MTHSANSVTLWATRCPLQDIKAPLQKGSKFRHQEYVHFHQHGSDWQSSPAVVWSCGTCVLHRNQHSIVPDSGTISCHTVSYLQHTWHAAEAGWYSDLCIRKRNKVLVDVLRRCLVLFLYLILITNRDGDAKMLYGLPLPGRIPGRRTFLSYSVLYHLVSNWQMSIQCIILTRQCSAWKRSRPTT